MKSVPWGAIKKFSKDHNNVQSISIKQLESMAIEAKDDEGETICYKAGYGQAMNDLSEFIRENRP